jgi:hypothetical protein
MADPNDRDHVRGSRCSDVWLADLCDAWIALGAKTDDERRAVAEALGFDYQPAEAPVVEAPPAPVDRRQQRYVVDGGGPIPTVRDDDTPREESSTPTVVALPTAVVSHRPAPPNDAPPQWLAGAVPLPVEQTAHAQFRPVHDPLLPVGWTRAILAALCSTRAEHGPLDIRRIVEDVCRAEPVAELPRVIVPTLRAGVQLLVDRGSAMMPFLRDIDDLVPRIALIAGRDRTPTWNFMDCPLRGVRHSLTRAREYWSPPAPGTPVIVISDFAMARPAFDRRPAAEEEWAAFAARTRANDCPLIAVTPFGPERWAQQSERLRSAFRFVSWDRATNVARARRIASGQRA